MKNKSPKLKKNIKINPHFKDEDIERQINFMLYPKFELLPVVDLVNGWIFVNFYVFELIRQKWHHFWYLSLEDKFDFEKVHLKFCKSVLGIKRAACNIDAKSELDRSPLTSFIKKHKF